MGCSRDARFGHAEYPHDLGLGTCQSLSHTPIRLKWRAQITHNPYLPELSRLRLAYLWLHRSTLLYLRPTLTKQASLARKRPTRLYSQLNFDQRLTHLVHFGFLFLHALTACKRACCMSYRPFGLLRSRLVFLHKLRWLVLLMHWQLRQLLFFISLKCFLRISL